MESYLLSDGYDEDFIRVVPTVSGFCPTSPEAVEAVSDNCGVDASDLDGIDRAIVNLFEEYTQNGIRAIKLGSGYFRGLDFRAGDTVGLVPWGDFARILPLTGLFLFDIKAVVPKLHRRGTQRDNRTILDNFRQVCENGARIWARIPMIGGNDSEAEIEGMVRLFKGQKCVELLPYHRYGI